MKQLSDLQIQRLAEKNRDASQQRFENELKKRGIDPAKKRKHVHVDRSEDPKIQSVDHRTLFNQMKRKPHS